MKKTCIVISALFLVLAARAGLPEGYAAIDGIASTSGGNQYILTDYVPSSCNIKIEATVTLTKWGTQGIWCSRMGTNDRTMTLFAWASPNYFRTDRNKSSSVYAAKAAPLSERVTLTADYANGTFSVGGEASANKMGSGDFTPASKLAFFASHTNGGSPGNYAIMSLHGAKVYAADGTTVECELVPVRKTSATAGAKDEYGLYDLVANKYYSSKGTDGFVLHVDVTAEFKEEGDDLLVLTVASGTYELKDADRQRIAASGRTLVKRGEGEVIPGAMPDFKGDIVLENGIWQVTEKYALGTNNNSRVFIKSGATLQVNRNLDGTVAGKKVYMEGDGYMGKGAIWALTTAWNSISGCSFYLTGDTYINQSARLDYYSFIDTCGYNLRFDGTSSSGIGANYFTNSSAKASTVLVNKNQIIVAQSDGNHYQGTSDNRLCLTNQANYSVGWTVSHDWTIEFQNGSKILPQKLTANTDTGKGKATFAGPGPVVFSGTVNVGSGSLKSKGTTNETTTISAPMRGSGKIVVDPGWLNVKSTDNTYAGTISVKGRSDVARAGIRVYDGAVYSAAETQLDNADFEYQNGQGLNLGALAVSGAQSSLTGPCTLEKSDATSVSRLTKTGAGILSLAGNMAIAKADVQAGTVRLANRYYGRAGLMEGEYVDMSASSQAIWCSWTDEIESKIGDKNWSYSPLGATKILNGYTSPFVGGRKHAKAVCYRGYLWNRNATNETWTFALHMTYRMMMRLNGNWTPWANSGESGTNLWTTTVKPGANPILVYSLSANWYVDQKPSKRFDGLGLSYFRGSVTKDDADPTQFAKLDDAGTGFLLTVDDADPSAGTDLLPQIAQATFGSGTTLDLGGNDYVLPDLTGVLSVDNAGTFTLGGGWTLRADDFAASPFAVTGRLAFGADAELDISFDPWTCPAAVASRLAAGVVVATATDMIEGLPTLSEALKSAGATLTKSADGRTLTLTLSGAPSVRQEDGAVKVTVAVPEQPASELRVRILRDGRIVDEQLLGPGYGRLTLDWSSDESGLYQVVSEHVLETGSSCGVVGTELLTTPDDAIRFVSTTGSDEADGTTLGTAKASVQAAVDALGTAGGRVYVMPGKYVSSRAFNTVLVSNAVQIVGWATDPSAVRFTRDGQNARLVQLAHKDAALRMVTLSGGYTWTGGSIVWPDKDGSNDMAGGANLYIAAAGGTAENCILTNGTATGWTYGGGNAYMKAGRLVNCELIGGGMKDLTNDQWRDAGASLSARAGVIENCWIHGVRPGSTGTFNAYVVCLYGSAKMVGCTVTDNVGYFCGGITVGDAAVEVYDTAIYGNEATWSTATETADLYLKSSRNGNNVTDPAAAFITCAATRAINASCLAASEPGFTDAANGDYTLTATSPLVNAGSTAQASGRTCAFDLLGAPRVTRGRVDIGCYEYRAPKFERRGSVMIIR